MHIRHLAVALVSLFVLSACGDERQPTGQPAPRVDTAPATSTEPTTTTAPVATPQYDLDRVAADLVAARERWESQTWTSYRYTYIPSCECDREEVTVEVIGGRLADPADIGRARSIEEWFDDIEAAIGTAAHIQVTYGDDGAPTSVYIDPDGTVADEEFGYELIGIEHVVDGLDAFLVGEYGCGWGFAVATPDQSVSFTAFFSSGYDFEIGPQSGSYELTDLVAEIRFGADLMANWCDDVIEEGEPEAVVDDTWRITGGTLELSVIDERTAMATLSDVVARTPDGDERLLGPVTITNPMWGFFAG